MKPVLSISFPVTPFQISRLPPVDVPNMHPEGAGACVPGAEAMPGAKKPGASRESTSQDSR